MMRSNEQAEQALIGCIVLYPDRFLPELVGVVQVDDFKNALYRSIYEACLRMFERGRKIDLVTILSSMPKPEQEQCKVALTMAASSTPAVSNFAEYARIVRECGILSRAEAKCIDLLQIISETEDAAACETQAGDILDCFADTHNDQQPVGIDEGMAQFIKRQQEKKEYIQTGFKKLDNYLYIEPGDYIVIGGRPSAGKTAFTLQVAARMAEKHNVAYFSLETKPDKIYDRLVALCAKTDLGEIKRREIKDWSGVSDCVDAATTLKFAAVPAAGFSVGKIRSYTIKLKADVIFIDYLTLISAQGKSLYEQATHISRDLHTMAQQLGIVVIALAQLNRSGTGEPDMTSIRESGQIEQDADGILFLHNEKVPEEKKLIIAKNKEGKTGMMPLYFEGQYQRFLEQETGR